MSEVETPTEANVNKYKRKRKKSFLKNARKYAKKGCFGRGSQLDSDLYNYFVRIMEVYREGFEDDEAKSAFVNNVFEQTQEKEIDICCNQVGCRVIESLLPLANEETIERFIKAFNEELRPLCSDRFASHVLEALVTRTTTLYFKSDLSDEVKSTCKSFTLKLSKFLLNNLEDFIWDIYGNHIVRTCLENLAQIPKEDDKKKGKETVVKTEVKVELPDDFIEVIKDFGERLINWPQFNELTNNELTSAFLQTLLKCLKVVDKKLLKKYLVKLLNEYFDPDEGKTEKSVLTPVFLSKSLIMLLETTLQVAKSKLFTQIYARCFVGRLAKLATIRNTNFTVQKLINNCREKVEFEAIFDELSGSFKEILDSKHTTILFGLAAGCKKFSTKQGFFVQNLMKILDCMEPEERQNKFVPCLAKLTTFSELKPDLSKDLSLHGTLIIQQILEFNKPIKIVNSLLNIETPELLKLLSTPIGCHVADSYMTSSFVGEKSRERLVKKLKGNFHELATSKYGSRAFEAIWTNSSLPIKTGIIEELSRKDGTWTHSEFGKIISNKIRLSLFKRNKANWKNSLDSKTPEQLFSDILK